MLLLSAKPVIEQIALDIKSRSAQFFSKNHRKPKLVVVVVGEDPASHVYVKKKRETALQWGFDSEILKFSKDIDPKEVRDSIEKLNSDSTVDGILVQRPLPAQFREEELVFWIHPTKDVDAFHPEQFGRLSLGLPCFAPCTPAGVMALLKFYQIPTAGKIACVIGRSSIVGKPMAQLLLQADSTLIHCHSKTRDLKEHCRAADLLIVAAGKPHLLDETFIKPGAVVVDVGIHRLSNGKLIGDVDFESASRSASAMTPVPGGVGPMTISFLLKNTLDSALKRS